MSESTNSVRLLLWDEPDIAARLADVMVASPSTKPAIDLGILFRWLAARCRADEAPQAKLCTVVSRGDEEAQTVRITAARRNGFGVVVKPGSADSSVDFSGPILSAIDRARQAGNVVEVLVASHDAARLGGHLEDLASSGVTVTVLGFREKARYAAASSRLGFVDVEEIDGLWNVELPRTNLFDLPDEGRELPPLDLPHVGQVSFLSPTPAAQAPVPAPAVVAAVQAAEPAEADSEAEAIASAAAAAAAAATSASVLDRVTAGLGQPAPPPPPPPAFGSSTEGTNDIFRAANASEHLEATDAANDALQTATATSSTASRVAPPPPPNSIFRIGRVSPPNGTAD